jgi:hypothetical protein
LTGNLRMRGLPVFLLNGVKKLGRYLEFSKKFYIFAPFLNIKQKILWT